MQRVYAIASSSFLNSTENATLCCQMLGTWLQIRTFRPLAWMTSLPPQPIRSPKTRRSTITTKKDRDPAVAVTWIPCHRLRHPRQRRCILDRLPRPIVRRTLSNLSSVQAHRCDRPLPVVFPAATRRASTLTIFLAISFITSISRLHSATSFFSRAFSAAKLP